MPITRFAPSPTGKLHLGHAYAALFAEQASQADSLFLRMEDLDSGRCRAHFEEQIYEDLKWLGLKWQQPIMQQSTRTAFYEEALKSLHRQNLVYPCYCSRKEIERDLAGISSAPHLGPTPIAPNLKTYPGTCRSLSASARRAHEAAGREPAWRIHMDRALAKMTERKHLDQVHWQDMRFGLFPMEPKNFGDFVLKRRDGAFAYHLAVVIDDAAQGVELVTRGEDLLAVTHVHRLLQDLLDLPVPTWHHHKLILDETGKRLAKRHESLSIESIRHSGKKPDQLRAELGF